ncbi:MAG: sulfatase-like hydrolase/transferase [bacterium]|nr:sulfatase-like hydrolase/transferase [bacterium]
MTRARTAVAVTMIAAVIFSCARPSDEPPATRFAERLAERGLDRPNLLLVTLDTTRADHLSCYGYAHATTPHLDRIAGDGIRFQNCTTPSAYTLPSHSSIMTGTYPTFHGVRTNGDRALAAAHVTLAERLSEQGYRTGAFIGAFVLDGRWGLNQGFDRYDDQFDLEKYRQIDLAGVQRPGNEVVDAALRWMDQEPGSPFFAWVHLYDPHAPYEPPEPYLSRFKERGLAGLYDGEIAFTDAQIGRLLARLEENGLADETILAVVGDHGEALGSHGELGHGYFVYDYAVQVPLLLRTPLAEFRGLEIAQQVTTIDLYPTLLEMLGLDLPPGTQGRSLVPLVEGSAPAESSYAYSESMVPYLQYGWSPIFSVRTERFKYIDAPRPELYDLVADPQERKNLAAERAELAGELRRVLERIVTDTSAGAPEPEPANVDQETLDQLAALGYLGGATAAPRTTALADPALADPKDKLEIYGKVALAGDLMNREEYEEALPHLEAVLELEPKIPQAKILVATCYVKTDRIEEAKRQLEEVLKVDPQSVQALISLANILSREGEQEEVIAIAERALAVDERNTQAYLLIGRVYMDRNDHRQALPHLRKAVEIQPKLSRNRKNLAACLVGLGRYGEAERILRDILAEYPEYPLAHFHLGLAYEEQGRIPEAMAAYRKEIEYYERSVPARFNLGKLLLKRGDAGGYLAEMEKVVELAPEQARGYLFLARGLINRAGELDRAHELVNQGLSLAEAVELKTLGYFLLADIYTRKGQRARVDEALAKARALSTE